MVAKRALPSVVEGSICLISYPVFTLNYDVILTQTMPTFHQLIATNTPAIGTLITLDSTEAIETLVLCGFDWFFIDLEHSALSLGAAQRLMEVVAGRATTLVRVPENSPVWIKRVLDMGCDGIIVPQVNSATEAKAAVAAAKYPPLGKRSVGIGRAHRYGLGFTEYVAHANTDTSVIIQIEHIDAANAADDILAVPGIDGVQLGPYDLSGSMNLLGQVQSEPVQAALRRAKDACKARHIPFGTFVLRPEAASAEIADGCAMIAIGTDTTLLASAAQSAIGLARVSPADTHSA